MLSGRRYPIALAAASGAIALLGAMLETPASADIPESRDPIKLAVSGNAGSDIGIYIYGGLIEKLGYEVASTPVGDPEQLAELKSGARHIGSLGWEMDTSAAMADGRGGKEVLDMGLLGVEVIEDWWYPLHVKAACPGLPDWRALLAPDCAEALSVEETAPKGRVLIAPVDGAGHEAERIEALGLPFELVRADGTRALTEAFVAAIQLEQPIIGSTRGAFWLPALYEGEFVVWPDYEAACDEEPSWGLNPDKTSDCGRPAGLVWKSAWAGGEAVWPKAYGVWRKLQFDAKNLGELIYMSDVEAVPVEVLAVLWTSQNEAVWKSWLE